MERVGFYLTGSHPVERVLPLIAKAARRAGERMLIVSDNDDQLAALDKALWQESPVDFLAHGRADAPHAERQPLLLARTCEPANGAKLVALADGVWRAEAERFDRAFVFFGEEGREAARGTWRLFDQRDDVTREYHALEGGKWIKKM